MAKRTKKKLKPIPAFASDEEFGEFWMTHDATDYYDFSTMRRVSFPNLKPSTTTISLRLPQPMLDELRVLANRKDVPYQSLLKVYLADRIAEEHRRLQQREKPDDSDALQRIIDELELLRDVQQAEKDVAAGRVHSHAAVAKKLRKRPARA